MIDCIRYLGSIPPFTLMQSLDADQCLLYGMEGSGKTTLLYKLKCPNWRKDQLIKDIKYIKDAHKDPAYHYEEFVGYRGFRYGIWDIPADEVQLNLTNVFYKFLRVSCVFFVVDTRKETAEDLEKIERTRRLFEFLLNEDELRGTAFVLIYNNYDDFDGTASVKPLPAAKMDNATKSVGVKNEGHALTAYANAVREMLGVEQMLESPAHSKRLFEISINCADVDVAHWNGKVIEFVRATVKDRQL